jgi:hypothetical protein
LNDELCKKYGYSTLETYTGKGDSLSAREYRAADNGQSWKFKLMADINDAMKRSGSRNAFIKEMNKKGYQVLWTSERKYITFTCPNGKKCRDIKLHDKKYEKENLEYEFYYRQKELYHSKFGGEKLTEYAKPYAEFNASDGSDSGKGLGYNAGYSADQRRALSEGVGDVYRTDYSGRDESTTGRLVGYGTEEVQPSALGSENSDSFPAGSGGKYPSSDEGLRTTGWEENRSDYERYLGQGRRVATSDSQSFNENREKSLAQTHGNIGDSITIGGSALNSAVHMVAGLIDESEDEEEQRKRIEAEQNASNLGALIGVAVGLLSPQDEIETENFGMKLDM